MAALTEGSTAPDFVLRGADGSAFGLGDALASGPVLLTFYKASCPTCQYALPFLDRLPGKRNGREFSAVLVSQDGPSDSERFVAEFDLGTRQVLDPSDTGFAVSNSYGLTNVPTVFLIEPDGRIAHSMVGWVKDDVETIARKLETEPVFGEAEDVLPLRPG